ncbi:MAG: hypothetical protein Fur009_8570 [Candidatus Microgenomates bacterium]
MNFFKKSKIPLSYDDIIIHLKKQKISFNRSTVFRNLNFLLKENFLIKVNLGDGKIRYELKNINHHHHIVCQKCKKIINFYDKELDSLILKLEKKLSKKNKIQITSHQIEFFGYCQDCL